MSLSVVGPDYCVLEDSSRSIEALSVKTVDGEWRKVPESWRKHVDLCQAESTYTLNGQQWTARCCERAEWVCADSGLCGLHFHQALACGQ